MKQLVNIFHLAISGHDLIKNVLEKEISSFRFFLAETPVEYQRQRGNRVPDLILLDLSLYSDFSEEIDAALNLQVPVILFTSIENEALAMKLVEKGVRDYIFYDRPARLGLVIKAALKPSHLPGNKSQLTPVESEEKYRSFFENSMDGILITVTDGQILAANPAACRMLQMTEKEICSAGRFNIVDPEDKRVNEAIKKRQKNGYVKAEVTFIRKDGSKFPGELTSSVFLGVRGEKRTSLIIRDISEKQRAEEKIRVSNENNRLLFNYAPLPSWIYDRNTLNIVDVNEAAIKHYGFSREEFLSMGIKDLRAAGDLPRLLEHLENIHKQKGDTGFSICDHLKKNGDKIRVETFGYHLKFAEKDCTLVTNLDVTEKENALRELKDNTAKLEIAQKIAKLGYWERNLEKEELFWSDEVYKIWEREKSNFRPLLETFLESVHPEDFDNFHQEIDHSLKNFEDLDYEHRIILPGGKIKWVHERGKLSRNGHGEIIFGGTVQDITDRKSFNEKLVLSEARNRGILKSQTNYLIRIDMEGRYSYCNDKFSEDFDWIFPGEELEGKLVRECVEEYHHERLKNIFRECREKPNTAFQCEIDKVTRSGETKTALWDFVCLTDTQNNPVEIQAVGIDITDRVKAQKDLWESNQRYELVSKAASDAIYDWNIENGIITWNDSYMELFGYSRMELTTTIKTWSGLVHPEDIGVIENLHESLSKNDNTWQAEYRYKKADGSYSYVNERGAIIRNGQGEAVRMVGAVQDITKRKLALQKLMLSEARQRGIIQSQTNYVIRTDLRGNYTYCNDKFIEEFSWIYNGKELIGESSSGSIKKYHYTRINEVVALCFEEPGKVYQVELDNPGKNGKTITSLWDLVFLPAATPEESELQCIGIDITGRVEAEAKMKFQADLLDKVGQAVIARDIEGEIVYWNRAATEIYGWSREEAVGQDIKKVIPNSRTEEEQEEVIQELKKGNPRSAEFMVKGKNGDEFPALVMDSPFKDEQGILKWVVSISSDISERKNNEIELKNYTKELIAANKGLEQFSFIVSHNLRAPLANLLGIANLLDDDDFPLETKERLTEELFNNIVRLDDVVKDLNAILRVRTEMLENKEEVNFYKLVDSIKGSIDHLIKKEQVEIVTDFAAQTQFTTVKSYLHSIFYNLISNSIKYRQPGKNPVIKISSRMEKDKLQLIFEDNGLGIDLAKKSDQVFGLYKRFHHHVEGKGMGLFMVKTQVESLGGKITLESKQNKGSRFILEFSNMNNSNSQNDEKATALHIN